MGVGQGTGDGVMVEDKNGDNGVAATELTCPTLFPHPRPRGPQVLYHRAGPAQS